MARSCKCKITGETGTTDIFIKIEGKYYKSQEIYDEYKENSNMHKKIIDIVLNDFLNYQKGQVFPTILTKKIKELSFYPNEVILKTIEKDYDNIKYWMYNKKFKNDVGKIYYLFAIIKANINDVYKDWKRDISTIQYENKSEIDTDLNINTINTTQKGKDISSWLEEDDL